MICSKYHLRRRGNGKPDMFSIPVADEFPVLRVLPVMFQQTLEVMQSAILNKILLRWKTRHIKHVIHIQFVNIYRRPDWIYNEEMKIRFQHNDFRLFLSKEAGMFTRALLPKDISAVTARQ